MPSDTPDYYSSIARIVRGETYLQFEARPDEKLKIFSAAHMTATPLAVGASEALADFETHLPTPYTSPVGWLADFREWFFTYDGLVRLDVVCGDFPALVLQNYQASRSFTHEYEQIIFFNTKFWDPAAASEHAWTFTIRNLDTVPVEGAVQVAMVLTDIGSHYPESKQVKCRVCGHVNVVSLKETKIKCKACGATFFVPFFPGKVI